MAGQIPEQEKTKRSHVLLELDERRRQEYMEGFLGKILLYGHTHESEEDRFYQNCLRQMQENDCRHVYDKKLWACNVGCMLPYMNYTPRTLAEILAGVEAET